MSTSSSHSKFAPLLANPPTIGVFSPYTLMLHADGTGERHIALLKRASVLFERLLVVPLGLGGFEDGLMSKAQFLALLDRKDPACASAEFQSMFLAPCDLGMKFEDLAAASMDIGEEDLWGPKHGSSFVKFVDRLVDQRYAEGSNRERYETKKQFIGNISADYRLLSRMMSTNRDLSGLFTALHEEAVLAVHAELIASAPAILTHVEGYECFDFASLSWEQIYELRKSGFSSSFRRKMAQWVLDAGYTQDRRVFEKQMTTHINEAKDAVVSSAEPHPVKTVLSGLAGLLPFGLGTLLGVGQTGMDLTNDYRNKERFGWLFFVNRAKQMAKRSEQS